MGVGVTQRGGGSKRLGKSTPAENHIFHCEFDYILIYIFYHQYARMVFRCVLASI